MSQLASIQKIIAIDPIEGKDRIELASVLGWKVIVGKHEFEVGDLCVYVQADVLLPEEERFEFLRSRCYSKKYGGFRIRTIKFGPTYSQGIVFPLSVLNAKARAKRNIEPGLDVSDLMGAQAYSKDELDVKKYVAKRSWLWRLLYRIGIVGFDRKRMAFPKFAIKSDETRL